jgi:tetratricopeptide (TPR) repeat protein
VPRHILVAVLLVFGALWLGGLLLGGYAGRADLGRRQAAVGMGSLPEQFALAQLDLAEGRLDNARQRLEYILATDPAFPQASEQLTTVLQALYATTTPTPPVAITPTPTRDPRPIQELMAQAQGVFAAQDWSAAIDLLSALRQADPAFQPAQVDGMLYLALRQRGVAKILQGRELEGGMYDLTLAERFGPMDGLAQQARGWARLYIIGLSFWEVVPQQAVYYFGQVAAAAPNLTDASGWTAAARYQAAVAQYAAALAASGDWCAAQEQYTLAAGADSPQAQEAALKCTPPTETPLDAPTETPALFPSPTPLPTEVTPLPTAPIPTLPAATDTPLPTPDVPTLAPAPTATLAPPILAPPSPTLEPTLAPTEPPPAPSETAAPQDTPPSP